MLNSPPCQWHNQADTLLNSSLRILILNRHQNRQISNLGKVLQLLQDLTLENRTISILNRPMDSGLNPNHNPNSERDKILRYFNQSNSSFTGYEHTASVTYFEKKTFHQQARLMRNADIVITIHGAAMTNIVFLKPCSIVIEVFPWVYHSPDYYGGLAKRAGLLHYEWQEHYLNTDLFLDQESEAKCSEVFNKVLRASKYNAHGGSALDQSDLDRANHACFSVENCRMCAQVWAIKGYLLNNVMNLNHIVYLRSHDLLGQAVGHSQGCSHSAKEVHIFEPLLQHFLCFKCILSVLCA